MEPTRSVDERRRAFVQELYGLHWALTSENPKRSGDARRALARLRRSFAGPAQQAEAYDIVFPHEPPQAEQELWLLVGGLFALHPHGNTAKGRTVGGAMRLLAEERVSARRRFTQLLSVEARHLPYYLRQAIQLLRSGDVAIDYHRLLTDLVQINSKSPQKVRLRWARDYYRPRIPDNRPSGNNDAVGAAEPPGPGAPASPPTET